MHKINREKRLRTFQSQQAGSVLVPVIIVAIILVLVLMWQAGMFTGVVNPPKTNTGTVEPAQASEQIATSPEANVPRVQETQLPERELTEIEKTSQRAKNYQPQVKRSPNSTGFELVPSDQTLDTTGGDQAAADAAPRPIADPDIAQAAAALIAQHRPDFSACKNENDPQKILSCAASEQSKSLTAAFATHNELRARGDRVSLERGGLVMQRVIEAMQQALEPFVRAAEQ